MNKVTTTNEHRYHNTENNYGLGNAKPHTEAAGGEHIKGYSCFVMQTSVCSGHTCTSACRLVAMVTTIICPGIWVAGMFEVIHLCTCNNSTAVAV